ncbi:16S rRNA (cytosine(1402)-N(4))-methyltransferase RsmH [Virgibacillus halophilus]|uniref:16S rRNA (cytosine(1402)-N(4))-methyltransferase RsmH n=1 Tax=Tigheibacillus halophilus TaxID=361280 RepID=UPI003645986C
MFEHETVLKSEAVEGLKIKPDGTYVDCTVGGGGHTANIASKLNESGRLVGFDQDENALRAAKEKLKNFGDRILFIHSNFRNLETQLLAHDIEQADGFLFDLGVSSPQLDQAERGFSYQHDAALDMRMDQSQDLDAMDIVNTWSFQELASIFFKYGEERFSKQIARKIEEKRKFEEITTTHQLVDIIKDAIPAPARRKGGHPAKRVFQALRIAVNDELGAMDDALRQAARMTAVGGRVAVITFHSLEDRLCKQAFKKWSTAKETPRHLPIIPESHEAPFELITRKPILPSEAELSINRRARSAKLRIAEKIKKWDDNFSH